MIAASDQAFRLTKVIKRGKATMDVEFKQFNLTGLHFIALLRAPVRYSHPKLYCLPSEQHMRTLTHHSVSVCVRSWAWGGLAKADEGRPASPD